MSVQDHLCSARIPTPVLTGLLIPASLLIILAIVPPHAFDLSVSKLFFSDGWPWHRDEVFTTIFYRLPKLVPAIVATVLLVRLAVVLAQGRRILEEEASRRALYVVIAMGACAAAVWWLKSTTGVACPWSVEPFGGALPMTDPAFGLTDVPGRCWPSGHAGTGFVFIAFYFALKDVRPRAAAGALLFAVAFGLLCGAVRVMEGAHFVSHVLVTGIVDWLICAALHALILEDRSSPAFAKPLSERGLVLLTAFWWTFVLNMPFLARAADLSEPNFAWSMREALTLAGLSIAVVNAMHNSLWSTYTVAATIPIAILMGLYMQIWRKGDVVGATVIGVVLLFLCILSGPWVAAHPEYFGWLDIDRKAMSILIPIYGFFASVLPVWLLLLPRDYLSTFLKIGTIGALAIGIAFVMPNFQMPAFTDFIHGGGPIVGGPVIPFIFITIACGALSGFHATIGTGTTPKMVGNERDVLFVGYGAMLMEGFVAIMALVAACVLVPADYFAINAPAEKFQALGMAVQELPRLEAEVQESLMARPGGSVSLAVGMAHIFSKIPFMEHLMAYWYHFAIMFEAVFILTAVDAGTRVGRFFLQEMIGKVIPKFADKEWVPGVIITSVLFTGSWGYLVYSGDIGSIWPLFGICNQLLASVTLLIGTTVILRMNKAKYAWITGVPGLFMTVITFWAGIWLIVNQYLPGGKILLATLSVIVMLLMLFVIYGTLRRWFALLAIHTTTKDEYGEDVKVVVQE